MAKKTEILSVEGMSCSHCENAVKKNPWELWRASAAWRLI